LQRCSADALIADPQTALARHPYPIPTPTQEEVEGKSKKQKKPRAKYERARAEINDVQAEFAREKEDILDTIRELTRQLKLKQLVMSAYIPLDQLSKIERCAESDLVGQS